jgi:hypothetical protein
MASGSHAAVAGAPAGQNLGSEFADDTDGSDGDEAGDQGVFDDFATAFVGNQSHQFLANLHFRLLLNFVLDKGHVQIDTPGKPACPKEFWSIRIGRRKRISAGITELKSD